MRYLLLLLAFSSQILALSQTCTPNANCSRGDFIDDFDFDNGAISNINSRGTSCGFPWNPGISYWNTNQTASIQEDSLYSFSLGSGNNAQFFAIWVDWNRDNDFDDADEFVYASNIAGTSFSGTIRSPKGISPGIANMRVRSRRNSAFTAGDACSSVPFGETEDYKLNQRIRFAPQADFSANSTAVAIGCPVQFSNQSAGFTNIYTWDFGDGQTSGLENPTHTYTSAGTYTASLTVGNSIGSDTETKTNYITVGASGGPVAATCSPTGGAISAGFGITYFDFAGSNKSSVDALAAGYEDFSCSALSVTQGQSYSLIIRSGTSALQNYRVWIDWNGDGFISNSNELVYSQNDVNDVQASVVIPATATINQALRVRVAAVYNLTAPLNNNFNACSNLSNGQIEDYSIRISPNTNAPIADFESDNQFSCDGVVQFKDKSAFVPSSWSWDFGDGSSSTQQNPTHSYSSNGTYTVRLTVSNAFGSNSISKFNFVTVNGNNFAKAACAVTTQSHISDYGIYSVSLNTINKSSGGGELGYEDFSCEANTSLLKQQAYAIEVRTGNNNNEDVKVWIDLNDDGSFSANELLLNSPNKSFHVDSITIPSSATTGKALRMRISSDFVGSNRGPCDNVTFGQVEDYSVSILENPNAVTADFTSDSTVSCSGTIRFSDLSSNNPSAWFWNFGDGNTSSLQNPVHTYTADGSYTVSLAIQKNSSRDTMIKTAYIVVDQQACNPIVMPENGTGQVLTSCGGRIYDSGGKGDYGANTRGIQSIIPTNASSLELTFQSFNFAIGDYLKIYDGPDTNASLIGLYTGTSLSAGSKIIATSGSICLLQVTDAALNASGFEASWSCTQGPTKPQAFFTADSTKSCKGFVSFSDLSTNNPTLWLWTFGDGTTSNQKNPVHFYSKQGKYTVRLIVGNAQGSDTLTKTQYIEVNNVFCFPESIEETHASSWVKVFPNPAKGQVNVLVSHEILNPELKLFDLNGKLVLASEPQVNSQFSLDIAGLPPGIYFLHVRSDEWLNVEKLRIE